MRTRKQPRYHAVCSSNAENTPTAGNPTTGREAGTSLASVVESALVQVVGEMRSNGLFESGEGKVGGELWELVCSATTWCTRELRK